MARYLAIIDEADGLFGVSFPDAPGCTAMGATQDEAIENAADALAEWVADVIADGGTPPKPRTLAELAASGEITEGAGQIVASIPLLLDSGRLGRANISIDTGLLAEIDEAARRRGVTRSAFLAAAARDKIRAGA